MPGAEVTPSKSTEDHSYSSQAIQEQGVNPSTATNNLSSSIALTQADPTQSQLESTTMDMDLQITDDQEGFILITNKKRRHSSDSVISKSTIQTPEHPVGLTVIFSPTNPEQSLMKLNMNKVSDAFELHCPECILMVRPNKRLNLIAVDTRNSLATKALLQLTKLCGMDVRAHEPGPRSAA
ncbi:hypothetical protein HPB47_016845, partial [Ixodes persulcatus]